MIATLAALLLIAGLITIHEFGHFLVARACGVHVKVFSVGIGGRLVGFTHKGTDYRLSWFPFGGYVRMAGADPFMEGGNDDDVDHSEGSFMAQPPWKRLLIVFAGPAMNLLLPFFVFTLLMVAGEPQPRADIGLVHPGSVADVAGLRPEDLVVDVDGTPTRTWVDVLEAFDKTEDPTVLVAVERGGERMQVALPAPAPPEGEERGRDPWDFGLANAAFGNGIAVDDPASPAGKAGLVTGDVVTAVGGEPVRDWNQVRRLALAGTDAIEVRYARGEGEDAPEAIATLAPDPTWTPTVTAADDALWQRWGIANANVTVADFSEDSAAQAAGLAKGDRILAVDGAPTRAWYEVVRAVAATGSGKGKELETRPLTITVRRNGEVLTLAVTPAVVEDTDELGRYRWRPLLGVEGGGQGAVQPPLIPRPYPLPQAASRATRETTMVAGFIIEQLGKLVTNEAAIRKSVGGPVAIFKQTRAAAERGIFDWARQLGLFSISLGIVNLLPIPVLDGGQFVIYLAEWVRGRPLPLILRERAQQAGIIFLVLLMLFVLVNDVFTPAMG